MTFLSPIFLWTLAGLSIPFLIHLFGKNKAKPLRFSSLLFLKSSSTKIGRLHKIEETLILLLRTIFLLFLLLFLAGPLSKSFIKFKKSTNIIFLVDDSYSMSAKNNPTPFNEAKTSEEKILSSLKTPSTNVGMVFLSGRTVPFTKNFSKIKNIIIKSHVSYYSGDMENAIERINKICSEKKGNTNIYFFTDMQKYTWRNFFPSGLNKNINFIIVNTGKNKNNNLSIESINKIPDTNTFSCKIMNWGKKNMVENIVFNAGGKQIIKDVSISKKNSARVLVKTPQNTSAIEAKLTKADLISDDNSFFLSLNNNKNRKILVTGNDAKGVFYIKSALEAELNPSYKITDSPETSLRSLNLDKYSIIFLVNPDILGIKTIEALHSFIHNGGNVVFFAGSNVLPNIFNNTTYSSGEKFPLMPVQFIYPIRLAKGTKIVWIDIENPIFRSFGNKIFQYLRTVSFSQCYRVKNISGETLAELGNNMPLIIEKNEGRGNIFLCTFSPDLSWTNFPEKPFFPVLINNIASYFLENESNEYYPGDTIFVSGNKNSVKVYAPSGKEQKIIMASNRTIEFIPDSPGFWTVKIFKNGNVKDKIFSVNCDWEEGNPEKISINEIKKIMAGYSVSYIKAAQINTFISKQKYSSNLSVPFLIIACIFLIGEIIASNFFHNKKAGPK